MQVQTPVNWTLAADIAQHGMPDTSNCVITEKTFNGDVMCITQEFIDEVRLSVEPLQSLLANVRVFYVSSVVVESLFLLSS